MASWIIAGLALLVALVATGCWRSAERDTRRAERERDQWATRSRHYEQQAAGYRDEAVQLSADNGQLRERNADLRDQLHTHETGEPSFTEAVLATLADLEITDPGDLR